VTSVDIGKSLDRSGLGGPRLQQQQDPTRCCSTSALRSTGVTEAGSATVRGVETTRYTGRLDFRKRSTPGSRSSS
jgi:hypothetical protein